MFQHVPQQGPLVTSLTNVRPTPQKSTGTVQSLLYSTVSTDDEDKRRGHMIQLDHLIVLRITYILHCTNYSNRTLLRLINHQISCGQTTAICMNIIILSQPSGCIDQYTVVVLTKSDIPGPLLCDPMDRHKFQS